MVGGMTGHPIRQCLHYTGICKRFNSFLPPHNRRIHLLHPSSPSSCLRFSSVHLIPLIRHRSPYNFPAFCIMIDVDRTEPNPNCKASSFSFESNDSASNPKGLTKVKVVIKGRVQGVFYRDWTVKNAKELDLKGWVRNHRDGYVEALFSGETEKVREMVRRCRVGPKDAEVTNVDESISEEDAGSEFKRIATVK